MPISKINNSLSFKQTQNPGVEPTKLYRLDDDTLYDIASSDARNRIRKVTNNSLKTVLIGLPVADAVVSGIAHNGQLSSKLTKSASALGKWAGVFAAAAVVLGVKRAVNSKSETLDNLDKNSRFLGFAIDFGALYAAVNIFSNLGKVSKAYAETKFPKFFNSFHKYLKQPVKDILNASVINKKIVKPFENYLTKHPHHNAAMKTAAFILAPIVAIATVLRVSKEINYACNTVDENFTFLKAVNNMLPEKNAEDSSEKIETNQ